jgi:hypothetical protein
MLLEIDEQIAQNTPTFFDYELKIEKLSQENLALKMRLKEMENEMLKAKIESLETQLKGNSVFFEERQKEWEARIGDKLESLETQLKGNSMLVEERQKEWEARIGAKMESLETQLKGNSVLVEERQKERDDMRELYDRVMKQLNDRSTSLQHENERFVPPERKKASRRVISIKIIFSEPIIQVCERLELERKNIETIKLDRQGTKVGIKHYSNKHHCSEIKIKDKDVFSNISHIVVRQYICSILNIGLCSSNLLLLVGISIPVTSDTKQLMEYLGIFEEEWTSSTIELYGRKIDVFYNKIDLSLAPFIKEKINEFYWV